MRSQIMVCKEINCGIELLLLFLTSFFRSYKIGGFFLDERKGYFNFLKMVVEKVSGLNFTVENVDEINAIFSVLKSKLKAGKRIIIPSNVKELHYFKWYKEKDWEHYFIVTDFNEDKNIFAINDNLHLSGNHENTEYGKFHLTSVTFAKLINDYWCTYVGENGSMINTFHRSNQFWLLEISQHEGVDQLSYEEIFQLIIQSFIDLVPKIQQGKYSICSINDFHLTKLRSLGSDNNITKVHWFLQNYLKDINFMFVYIKIILHIVKMYSSEMYLLLNQAVKESTSLSEAIRNKILARYLRGGAILNNDWLEELKILDLHTDKIRDSLYVSVKEIYDMGGTPGNVHGKYCEL